MLDIVSLIHLSVCIKTFYEKLINIENCSCIFTFKIKEEYVNI